MKTFLRLIFIIKKGFVDIKHAWNDKPFRMIYINHHKQEYRTALISDMKKGLQCQNLLSIYENK